MCARNCCGCSQLRSCCRVRCEYRQASGMDSWRWGFWVLAFCLYGRSFRSAFPIYARPINAQNVTPACSVFIAKSQNAGYPQSCCFTLADMAASIANGVGCAVTINTKIIESAVTNEAALKNRKFRKIKRKTSDLPELPVSIPALSANPVEILAASGVSRSPRLPQK